MACTLCKFLSLAARSLSLSLSNITIHHIFIYSLVVVVPFCSRNIFIPNTLSIRLRRNAYKSFTFHVEIHCVRPHDRICPDCTLFTHTLHKLFAALKACCHRSPAVPQRQPHDRFIRYVPCLCSHFR